MRSGEGMAKSVYPQVSATSPHATSTTVTPPIDAGGTKWGTKLGKRLTEKANPKGNKGVNLEGEEKRKDGHQHEWVVLVLHLEGQAWEPDAASSE